jgi:hypothetical protein
VIRCEECGEFFLLAGDAERHTCPPEWEVWRDGEDREVEGRRVHADDAEEAAARWAKDEDAYCADYHIIGGRETPTVRVARADSEDIQRFEIEGEAVPHYIARKVG